VQLEAARSHSAAEPQSMARGLQAASTLELNAGWKQLARLEIGCDVEAE
jgi:hypothetical protein